MRTVQMDEFYKLPEGTLCASWNGAMYVKHETIYNDKDTKDNPIDFFYSDITDIIDYDSMDGTSYEVDYDSISRDGVYDDTRMWVVFEDTDIVNLITKLYKCLLRISE